MTTPDILRAIIDHSADVALVRLAAQRPTAPTELYRQALSLPDGLPTEAVRAMQDYLDRAECDTRATKIQFRCTVSDKHQIERNASAAGLTLSEFIRSRCLEV